MASEATMASEAVGGNMLMDARVFKLLISNLMFYDLRGCLKAAMAQEAIGGTMHMDTRVIKIDDFKSEVI